MMKQQRLVILLLAGVLSLVDGRVHAVPQRPNVLIILADDMGFSDLGSYGGEIATPHLDALAHHGLRFTQFYNTARCWSSRAALLTGYYAQQVRRDTLPDIPGGIGLRPAWARLLPEMLKPLGYRSYHAGKWHLDGQPLPAGFDHAYVLGDYDRHFTPRRHAEDDKPLPAVKPGNGYYSSTAITDYALIYLQEHTTHFATQPFFIYLAYTAPHFPLQALPTDIARYQDRYRIGWNAIAQARWQRLTQLGLVHHVLPAMERDIGPPYDFPEAMAQLGRGEINRPLPWQELTDAQRDFQAVKMAIHAAMVNRMDQEIGRVVELLKQLGVFDSTLIFFLSDNGASSEIMVRGDGHDPQAAPGSAGSFLCLGPGWSSASNTPLRRHKTWVHEGGIATPLIVHWPQGIAARGELRHNPGHLIDIVPTILEVAGGKRLETWEGQPVPAPPGQSLVPVFTHDYSVQHDSLWWLHEGNRALRVGDWKIVAAGKDGPWELYNLSHDRGESVNLAASLPDKVQQLAALWQQHTEAFRQLILANPPPAQKQDTAEQEAK